MSDHKNRPKYDWRNYPPEEIPSSTEPPKQLTNSIRRGESILDIGCGVGRSTLALASIGHRISGIDINPLAIARAKTQASEAKVDVSFTTADATHLHNIESAAFDAVLMQAFLTTLATPEERTTAISESFRVLKLGGKLFMVEFLQNWNSSNYRDRYIRGIKLNLADGTFPVFSE
ncbi:MAG: class I SAM-dependent methyltransferase [Planctomycetaceae bacterium]|nr:class I SAM-dependent methyltransferase [Planctomycetaceae bacterium]MCB9951835.1 class I SAM-dependent methyltransferase [Planctomycetaceae bacterium]